MAVSKIKQSGLIFGTANIGPNDDFNDWTTTGLYWLYIQGTPANKPPESNDGFFAVFSNGYGDHVQVVVNRPEGHIFTRGKRSTDNAWGTWKMFKFD